MPKTIRKSKEFKSIEEYENEFFPLRAERLDPKEESPRRLGIRLAQELLEKYKMGGKSKS